MSDLHLRAVTRLFPSGAGCAGITLAIPSGEMVALLGPSGCGKSTLLRTVAGLEPADAGQVLLDGQDFTGRKPEERSIVMLFQQPLLFPHLTAAENAAFPLRLRGASRRDQQARAREMLRQVQLGGLDGRYPHQLSGGQQQRVALARALLAQPKVLLLDEPFSALDAPLRAEMRHLLRQLQRELRLTVLFVTHDQEEAALLGDRVAVMHEGRLHQVGPATELYYRPATLAVARFVGTSTLLPGLMANGHLISSLGRHPAEGAPEGPAWGVVRPEQVAILPITPDEGQARITELQFAGGQLKLRLRAGTTTLTARPADVWSMNLVAGDAVSYRIEGPVWCVSAPDLQALDGAADQAGGRETA